MIRTVFLLDEPRDWGGPQGVLLRLARGLDPQRYRSEVVILGRTRLRDAGVAVLALSARTAPHVLAGRLGPRAPRLLLTCGRRADLVGPWAAALLGAACVSIRRDPSEPPRNLLQRRADRLVSAVAVATDGIKDDVVTGEGMPEDRVAVIADDECLVRRHEALFDELLAEIGSLEPRRTRPSRRLAKAAVAGAYSTLRRLGGRLRSRDRAWLCLCYHRVRARGEATDPWLVVGAQTLRRQLETLGRTYDFVTAQELARRISKGASNGRPICAVTFDDGYADNLENGLPVLQRLAIPGTVYVSTSVLDGEALWFERVGGTVARAMEHGMRQELEVALRDLLGGRAAQVANPLSATRSACAALKDLPSSERAERIAELERRIGAPTALHLPRYLSSEEVLELRRAGWEVGCHTRTHPILPRTSDNEAREEIVRSRNELGALLGQPPAGFAYPNGDCDDRIVALVREAGFDYAVVARPDQARHRDPYRILRRCVSDHSSRGYAMAFSGSAFLAEVEGALDPLR